MRHRAGWAYSQRSQRFVDEKECAFIEPDPIAEDPELRPVYPSRDLGPAEEHLRLFLIQYWGGPRTYDERRGHPRLRMRHRHFSIGEAERDAWLRHMRAAMDEIGLDEARDAQLWEYMVMAAHSLVNTPPESGGPDLGLTPA